MLSDEVSFPRGGSEKIKLGRPSALVNIFKTPVNLKKRKNERKRGRSMTVGSHQEIPSSDDFDNFKLSYKPHECLAVGQLLLGCVSLIEEFSLVLSLPSCLEGTVLISNISEAFTKQLKQITAEGPAAMKDAVSLQDMFHVGQCLICKIIEVEKDEWMRIKHIDLSIDPSTVNHLLSSDTALIGLPLNVAVLSLEDHGYILYTGIENLSGFIAYENLHSNTGKLKVGQTFSALIKKVNKNKSLEVSVHSADKQVFSHKFSKFHMLPGVSLNVKIAMILPKGIVVRYGTNSGIIPYSRLLKDAALYSVGDSIKVTLLGHLPFYEYMELSEYTDTLDLGFGISIKPVQPVGFLCVGHVHQVLPKKMIINLEFGFGISTLKHLRKIKIGDKLRIDSSCYPLNSPVKCRIVQFHYLDNLYVLSPSKSALKNCKLNINDVKVGELIKCRVVSKRRWGYTVVLGQTSLVRPVLGLLHHSHVRDSLQVSDVTNCRVLQVNIEEKTVKMTAIPELLDLNDIVSGYENVVGLETKGIVEQIHDGCGILTFFNGVEAKFDLFGEMDRLYQAGQLVSCKIVYCDAMSKEIKVKITDPLPSFISPTQNHSSKSIRSNTNSEPAVVNIQIGDICGCYVTGTNKTGVIVALPSAGTSGFVSKTQFSDFVDLCDCYFTLIKEGMCIKKAVCISLSPLAMSLKESLSDSRGRKKLSVQRRVGGVHAGFVIKVNPTQLEVCLPSCPNYRCICLLKNEKNSSESWNVDQTITCVVKRIDHSEKVIFAHCNIKTTIGSSLKLLNTYLKELDQLFTFWKQIQGKSKLLGLHLGSIVEGKVLKTVDGYWLRSTDGLMLCVSLITKSSDFATNSFWQLVWFNPVNRNLYIKAADSLKPNISVIPEGREMPCKIIMVQFNVIIAASLSEKSLVIYLPGRMGINDTMGFKNVANVGEECQIQVKNIYQGIHFGVCKDWFKMNAKVGTETFENKSYEVIDLLPKHDIGDSNCEKKHSALDEECSDADISDGSVESVSNNEKSNVENGKKFLRYDQPFEWDDNTGYEETENSGDEIEENRPQPRKKRKIKQDESKIFELEKALTDSSRLPQSIDDYERLVLSSPNSSIVWLNYMAFHLQAGDFEKAVHVARKALKVINMTEVNEKFNIWVGLLNVESLFGSLETFNEAKDEALKMNDSLKVYFLVATIHEQHGRSEAAEDVLKVMVKKFKGNMEVWYRLMKFLMKQGKYEESRELLKRSEKCLLSKDYKTIIGKFAALEFEHGDKERGKTMMENIITTSAKGVETYLNVYLDVLQKHGEANHARLFLNKLMDDKLNTHRLKLVFKRLFEIETEYGNPEEVQRLKDKAKQIAEDMSIGNLLKSTK